MVFSEKFYQCIGNDMIDVIDVIQFYISFIVMVVSCFYGVIKGSLRVVGLCQQFGVVFFDMLDVKCEDEMVQIDIVVGIDCFEQVFG